MSQATSCLLFAKGFWILFSVMLCMSFQAVKSCQDLSGQALQLCSQATNPVLHSNSCSDNPPAMFCTRLDASCQLCDCLCPTLLFVLKVHGRIAFCLLRSAFYPRQLPVTCSGCLSATGPRWGSWCVWPCQWANLIGALVSVFIQSGESFQVRLCTELALNLH